MLVKGLLIAIMAIGCCSAADFDERMINGTRVGIEKYPFQVQVYSTEIFCGGVILSEYFVLTAAQCTHDIDEQAITVLIGASYSRSGGRKHNVANIHEHPKYQDHGDWKEYDVSVLKLKTGVDFSTLVKTVQLPESKQLFSDGFVCVVLGWGIDIEDDVTNTRPLKSALTKLVSNESCAKAYDSRQKIKSSMMCAWNGVADGIRGPCYGDAGGGLYCSGTLAGITSFGGDSAHCNLSQRPYVYTYVADPEILSFIHKSMDPGQG